MFRSTFRPLLAAGLLVTTAANPAFGVGENVVVNAKDAAFDRWNYPFNGTPGTRGAAPTFLASGTPAFDERDGQFLVGFDTASMGVTPGLNPADYQVNSLTITATHSTGAFVYDPTYDSYQTYLSPGDDGGTPGDPSDDTPADPNFTADADAGRPIVLTGAGLRGGFNEFTFGAGSATAYAEGSPFGDNGPTPFGPDATDRNAFAADFDSSGNLRDISNNVGTNFVNIPGFDINPWAVGTTNLNPGDPVIEAVAGDSPGSTFTFTLDLSDPDILGYVQEGLAEGGLFFSITSLHTTGQSGGTNPNFYTHDNFDPAAIGPQVSFDVTVVPEPASLMTLALGGLAVLHRGRRRAAA